MRQHIHSFMSRPSRCCSTALRTAQCVVLLGCLVSGAQGQLLLNALRARAGNDSSTSSSTTFPWAQSVSSPAPLAGGHWCRMERESAHTYCGLPYELSNFQGEIVLSGMASVIHRCCLTCCLIITANQPCIVHTTACTE